MPAMAVGVFSIAPAMAVGVFIVVVAIAIAVGVFVIESLIVVGVLVTAASKLAVGVGTPDAPQPHSAIGNKARIATNKIFCENEMPFMSNLPVR